MFKPLNESSISNMTPNDVIDRNTLSALNNNFNNELFLYKWASENYENPEDYDADEWANSKVGKDFILNDNKSGFPRTEGSGIKSISGSNEFNFVTHVNSKV